MNKKINKYKLGFTLVELMIFFVVLSAILAASMPIITKHTQNLPVKTPHGTYICTRTDNGYKEINITSAGHSETDVSECKFTPRKNVSLYKIELIGAGAGGYEADENNDLVEESQNYYAGEYNIPSIFNPNKGYNGNLATKLTDEQLKYILNNKHFKIIQPTGDANTSYGRVEFLDAYTNLEYEIIDNEREIEYYDEIKALLNQEVHNDTSNIENLYQKGPNELYPKYKHDFQYLYSVYRNFENKDFAKKYDLELRDIVKKEKQDANTNSINYETPIKTINLSLKGGKQAYLVYDGNINLDDVDNVDRYLQNLFTNKYTWGYTTSKTNCDNLLDKEPPSTNTITNTNKNTFEELYDYFNFANFVDKIAGDNIDYRNIKWGNKGNDGAYGAIKIDNKCYKNLQQAKALNPPLYYINDDSNPTDVFDTSNIIVVPNETILNYFNQDQRPHISSDASDIIVNNTPLGANNNSVSIITTKDNDKYYEFRNKDNKTYIPVKIQILSNLNKRIHTVGAGGKAGEYKVFYTPSLPDDCEFIVSPGGHVMSEETTSDSDALGSTISCNSGALQYHANGGNGQTKFFQYTDLKDASEVAQESKHTHEKYDHTYEMVENIDLNSSRNADPRVMVLKTSSTGELPSYVTSNIFSNIDYINQEQYGKGGNGNMITDNCYKPWGTYKTDIVYNNNQLSNGPKYEEKQDTSCTYEIKLAEPGNSGAIIITW